MKWPMLEVFGVPRDIGLGLIVWLVTLSVSHNSSASLDFLFSSVCTTDALLTIDAAINDAQNPELSFFDLPLELAQQIRTTSKGSRTGGSL